MKIILFHQTDNLFKRYLSELNSDRPVKIITPSPQYADLARRKLSGSVTHFDVVTVAKFIRDELIQLVGEEATANYYGKAELILLLSSLWKKLNLEKKYEVFSRSFRLLTDFRSFSMSDDVIETVLEHYDEITKAGVLTMHKVLNQLDAYDEHRSYFKLSERLREGDLPITYPTEKNLVFFGFDFMSGSQLDLVKAYDIRDNVIIPFPYEAFQESQSTDWIKWLTEEESLEVIDEARDKREVPVARFPKNYLNTTLKSHLMAGEAGQIFLSEKKPTFENIQEVNLFAGQFKVSHDLFSKHVEILKKTFEFEKEEPVESVLEKLERFKENSLIKQDFAFYKTLLLFEENILQWKEISEANIKVTDFDREALFETLLLNLPRVSLSSALRGKSNLTIKGLKNIDEAERETPIYLCITSDHGSLKSNIMQYSEGVEQYLASIGPIRRTGLEFAILKYKILDLLNAPAAKVFIEEGLEEKDLGWNDILSSLKVKNISNNLSFGKEVHYPHIDKANYDITNHSATMLQTYQDCPRKFYTRYVKKFSPLVELESDINMMELGRVEHEVIGSYISQYKEFDEATFKNLITEVLQKNFHKKTLSSVRNDIGFVEVFAYTKPVVLKLIELHKELPGKFVFEKDISQFSKNARGSIDYFYDDSDFTILLDFKRGTGSIPSQIAFKNFEKIQIWYYLNRVRTRINTPHIVYGYFNLSEPEKSLIFANDEFTIEKFQDYFGKIQLLELDESLPNYSQFEQEIIRKIQTEEDFLPEPKDILSCSYCDLSRVCARSREAYGS